uniref:Uncharacterized protein n=1 Tax=Salix viminalis TaxID=40686 RepID=A0A6N2M3T5_SALVM
MVGCCYRGWWLCWWRGERQRCLGKATDDDFVCANEDEGGSVSLLCSFASFFSYDGLNKIACHSPALFGIFINPL